MALRTARRTTGGSALPAAGAPLKVPRRVQITLRVNQLLNTLRPNGRNIALNRPGGYCGVAAPVPIPNTAVKRPSANGTSSQDAGE
jgi:hypothetical protein